MGDHLQESGLDKFSFYAASVYCSAQVDDGTGAGTNQITNLSNSSNTNPYFHYPGLSSFPQDVWCVSIGVIQANNDDNTDSDASGRTWASDLLCQCCFRQHLGLGRRQPAEAGRV